MRAGAGGIMIGRLNHVAIAVGDIAKARKLYRDTLGADVSGVVPQPDHGVNTVFITLPNTKIELLEPLGENSPIAKFLERNPDGGIHHICYEVDDILAARDKLKAKARACSATAIRRSARTASRCCSCIRRIFAARWWRSSRRDAWTATSFVMPREGGHQYTAAEYWACCISCAYWSPPSRAMTRSTMAWTTALAIYFIIWWVVLFAVLPFGVRNRGRGGRRRSRRVTIPARRPSSGWARS
jgi:methylmalonyl-CoA/ethylmalonyl-CoA epimerase